MNAAPLFHEVSSSGGATIVPATWNVEPAVVACLAVLAGLYAAGVLRLCRERRFPAAGLSRAVAYGAGIGLLAVALMSPLDAWADRLFAAHMGQHLILMMVAPPLLIAGRPIAVALWALPRSARHALGAWWRGSTAARPGIERLCGPLSAWLAASAALWFWHLPKPYGLAYDNTWVHGLEHLTFVFAGILFWRVVIADPQSRRLSPGATMLFVATFAMQNSMLGALLIFAAKVLYAAHAAAPPWSPLTPLEDQQLAGILMWLVTGVMDLGAIGVLFVMWLASGSRRALHA